MNLSIDLIKILLPVIYFIDVWTYGKAFFKSSKTAEKWKSPLLYFTVALHLLYLLLRTVAFSHPPITKVFEIMTVVAFSISFAYIYIELKTKVKNTGYFILMVAFFFQLISSILIQNLLNVPEVLRSNLLGFHVISALLGFSAITISAIYGMLYLMLYHDIKSNRFGVIYQRLPNLEIMERMSFTATTLGFCLLTIAIIIGMIWLPKAFEKFSYADPKLIGTAFIWLLYGIGLIAKKIAHWQGKKIVWLSIIGFIISLFSMTAVNMFFSGFHKFN
jgi:HemX protein